MTFVNTLVTVSTRIPEHDAKQAAGARLKKALDGYYPRARGGLRKLSDEAKIGPETLYRWFRGDSEPDLGTLARVAAACGVTRTALVAAMDGEPVPVEQAPAWAAIGGKVDEVLAAVAELREGQSQVAEEAVQRLIDALAPGELREAAERVIARLEALPEPNGEAPDDPAAVQDQDVPERPGRGRE